jgi:hypothetical protein
MRPRLKLPNLRLPNLRLPNLKLTKPKVANLKLAKPKLRGLLLLPCFLATPLLAAEPGGTAGPGPIQLIAQPTLSIGLAGFPRIASPAASSPAASSPAASSPAASSPAASSPTATGVLPAGDAHVVARINQGLAEADSRARDAAKSCEADARDAKVDSKDPAWQRSVTVAMRGPAYLSLVASDAWYCGGAYPDADSFALAYDLRTGAPLNWARLLPKTLVGTASLDTAGDGTRIGVAASPALTKLYLTLLKPDADCASALREGELQFMLWPDAARAGVAMRPSGLAHAIAACGDDAVIPLATLRTLGAEPALLDAIEAGHRDGLFGMTR